MTQSLCMYNKLGIATLGAQNLLRGGQNFRILGSGPAKPWQNFYVTEQLLHFPESLSQVGQDQEGGSVMVTPQFTPITVS